MDEFLDVVFDVPLDRRFTYRNDPAKPAVPGARVEAVFGKRKALGFVVASRSAPPEGLDPARLRPISRRVDEEPLFTDEQILLARWMARSYFASEGECLARMLPGGRRESEFPGSGLEEAEIGSVPIELSGAQAAALEGVFSPGGPTYHYLFGVTGSGKTEVFLRSAARVIEEGRGAIYLVPEIALSAQVEEAVKARFGPTAAVIHSGLTPSQKLAEWRRILSGEAMVVVGARSAVFAPVRNLGLIVVDEEHEGSYKSGSSPRYHARQVAMRRCTDSGAILLMGSATPSVEAWHLMAEGKIARHDLGGRLSGGAESAVRAVSMRGEADCLSKELQAEIRDAKAAGRQTILFLNRRGFSYFFHCMSCGYELKCEHCSVSLTFHKERGRMICHYCGYQREPPSVCPECGSLDVGYSGFGTEAVEEEVARLFPGLSARRLDADALKRKGDLERILSDFRSGKIDILLGTQMVAKGLNFPGVRLVGVVMADTALHLPDFRAAERTFSLIVQVSGRAGRFFPDGRVLVQTLRPEALAVRCAVEKDAEGFYSSELEERKAAGFPPFARLVRFVFRSKDRDRAKSAASSFAEGLRPALPVGAEILGPAECPIGRVSGSWRFQVIFRAADFGPLHAALRDAWESYAAGPGVYVEADPDPVSLL
jgi:primosomal protein N' (replication factor Y) (superfamily II helicase)